jgi:hypothetical protein
LAWPPISETSSISASGISTMPPLQSSMIV